MAGLKEIRRRITSIKNTKQITRAMKLVSAAKLRRAQQVAESGRDYRARLERSFQTLLADVSGELSNPYLKKPSVIKNRIAVVCTADRGLCGAYNANLVKAVLANEGKHDVRTRFVLMGRKGVAAAHRFGWEILKGFEGLGENPSKWPVDEVLRLITAEFAKSDDTEVVLYYTKFVSAMSQRVARENILPFAFSEVEHAPARRSADHGAHESHFGHFKYSLPPEQIIAQLIPLLMKTQIVQAALESKASEHAARMTAMDSATSNADDLISKLRLFYNRARQSAITRELIDIVGGAEALK